MQFVQIYVERIYDLLSDQQAQLSLREEKQGGTFVQGATTTPASVTAARFESTRCQPAVDSLPTAATHVPLPTRTRERALQYCMSRCSQLAAVHSSPLAMPGTICDAPPPTTHHHALAPPCTSHRLSLPAPATPRNAQRPRLSSLLQDRRNLASARTNSSFGTAAFQRIWRI